jgi:hypothetical protein
VSVEDAVVVRSQNLCLGNASAVKMPVPALPTFIQKNMPKGFIDGAGATSVIGLRILSLANQMLGEG